MFTSRKSHHNAHGISVAAIQKPVAICFEIHEGGFGWGSRLSSLIVAHLGVVVAHCRGALLMAPHERWLFTQIDRPVLGKRYTEKLVVSLHVPYSPAAVSDKLYL
jgi:hypothetical protein